jgi:Domain of unknown function (DUF6434)/SAP domain-containing new25
MTRPDIQSIQTGEELKRWYWLKKELTDYCKLKKWSYEGSKFDILDRIAKTLDKGNPHPSKPAKAKAKTSKFDWHSEKLTLHTVLTDSYRNTQNVRRFFQQHCGPKFHFSIPFMAFMNNNSGKTLQDAVNEWHRLNIIHENKAFKSDIPPGNQYNQYIRDFCADNPNASIAQARHFWKLKKSLPMQRHKYERTDLKLK